MPSPYGQAKEGKYWFFRAQLKTGETSKNLRYARLEAGIQVGFVGICLSGCKAQEFLITGKAGVCPYIPRVGHRYALNSQWCVLDSERDHVLLALKLSIKNCSKYLLWEWSKY